MKAKLQRDDLIYPELCYQVIGAQFEAWNHVGPGHKEKFYQKAVAQELSGAGLVFKTELPVKINYKGKTIGTYFFDFLIENKIVLETKVRNYFSKRDIDQLYAYLRAKNLKLGIIVHFTKTGVKFKRVVNIE
ncbi:MAG: GxxExxY protein [Candidatus Liptonbacteria bacterium]|nr:GxxExxY protein [Candidatus Liptonbacteria bacterium]